MKNIEIAQLLQISPATVSLALNNKPGVSEATRRKILELKESSSTNVTSESYLVSELEKIGLFVFKNRADIIDETPFFVTVIETIGSKAKQLAYKPNIFYSEADSISEIVSELNESDINGLIVVATEMESCHARFFAENLKIPFVMVDAAFPECDVDCVLMNNRGGIKQAVEYGYRMGHRQIGFLDSAYKCNNFIERYDSYKYEISRLGLQFDTEYIFSLRPNVEEAREDMQQILQEGARLPTLLIAANDKIAIGAISAIRKAGYRIPEDVSIIGFDDMPTVKYLTPALTSLRLMQEQIAQIAIDRLIQKMHNPKEACYTLQQYVSVRLEVRDSVWDLNKQS